MFLFELLWRKVTQRLVDTLSVVERYEEAEVAINECLEIKSRLLGDEHPDTLGVMSNLAVLYESLNRFPDAQELHARVLEIHRLQFSSNHPRVAASLNNLGSYYLKRGGLAQDQDQLDSAVSLLTEGSNVYLRVRGPDHPDTFEIQSHLAHAYSEQRRHESEPLLTDLVERLMRLRGPTHVPTLETMNVLGWTNMHLDRLAEAENVLMDALENGRRLDERAPWKLQVMGNLAIVCYRMGKLEKSISLDEAALDLTKEALGPDHVETLPSIARLGLSYLEAGRTNEGRSLLENTFDASQNLPGSFKIADVLATSYAQDDDAEKARLWADRLIRSKRNKTSE